MTSVDLTALETNFFKRGNPLKKLLSISLALLNARQTGILYGTNETRMKFLPTAMWDRGIMDRFDGRGPKGVVLKLFGTRIVTARNLSPVMFYKAGPNGEQTGNDGIIAYVLRNCADYYKKGISVIICPDTDKFRDQTHAAYLLMPFYVYNGKRIEKSQENIKADVRIVRQFNSGNSIYIYLPDYGILVVNTADTGLLRLAGDKFAREPELIQRLDQLIKLVETASLAYLGKLKGKRGAELLWRKEEHLRQTSQNLAANEKRFRDLYENAPIAYLSMDPDGIIYRSNRRASELCGYSREALEGRDITTLIADRHDPRGTMASIWERLRTGSPVKDMEIRMKKNTGETVWVSLSVDAVKGDQGRIAELRAMAVDISGRKSLEKKLFQAQKMEAIGTLARGIAHDFNNLLSPISGYAQMLLMDANASGRPARETETIQTILNCAGHARELVSQILTFSRQNGHEFILVKAETIVAESLGFVRSFLPATIMVTTFLDRECGFIKASPVQINQIIMNLVTNAFHAMEGTGGSLEVSLHPVVIRPDTGESGGMNPGIYVCLEVADTGHGIEAGIRDKIFEPYFSTKDEKKGSGIGLSVVHGIVKSHGGHIRVAPRKEEGTRVSVYLPQCRRTAETWEPGNSYLPLMTGTGRILLVDDDENVAVMLRRMMEKLGYRVDCFFSSPAALEALKKEPSGFDILVTDLTMPDLTGMELIREAEALRPDLPVLLCSGIGDTIARDRDCPSAVKGILNKPVEIKYLSFLLKQLLEPAAN